MGSCALCGKERGDGRVKIGVIIRSRYFAANTLRDE